MISPALAVACGGVCMGRLRRVHQPDGLPNLIDVIFGTMLIILVLEASRRISGWSLVILSDLHLYGLVGRSLPESSCTGYDWRAIVNHAFINTEGIYGTSVDVAASYIFLFILFGTIMNKCGDGAVLQRPRSRLRRLHQRWYAKVAVIASGLLGSINGSAVANVVTTGTFTIPLMKKSGYPKSSPERSNPRRVWAVSCCLRSWAAAFIMAEMLGVKYGTIVISAAIPALLYYLGIMVQVQLRANRRFKRTSEGTITESPTC